MSSRAMPTLQVATLEKRARHLKDFRKRDVILNRDRIEWRKPGQVRVQGYVRLRDVESVEGPWGVSVEDVPMPRTAPPVDTGSSCRVFCVKCPLKRNREGSTEEILVFRTSTPVEARGWAAAIRELVVPMK